MNNKLYRYFIGIIIGIIVTWVYRYFELTTIQYILLLVLSAVLITFVYYKVLVRKKKDLEEKLNPSLKLLEEGNIDEFLSRNIKLFKEEKDELTKLNILMYLLVGYDKKHDYKSAKELMLEIEKNKLPKQFIPVYNANLAMICFKADDVEEALKIMEENSSDFKKYDNTYGDMGVIIAYCRILESANKGDYKEALDIIEEKREHIGNEAFEEEYQLLQKAIKEDNGNMNKDIEKDDKE